MAPSSATRGSSILDQGTSQRILKNLKAKGYRVTELFEPALAIAMFEHHSEIQGSENEAHRTLDGLL